MANARLELVPEIAVDIEVRLLARAFPQLQLSYPKLAVIFTVCAVVGDSLALAKVFSTTLIGVVYGAALLILSLFDGCLHVFGESARRVHLLVPFVLLSIAFVSFLFARWRCATLSGSCCVDFVIPR